MLCQTFAALILEYLRSTCTRCYNRTLRYKRRYNWLRQTWLKIINVPDIWHNQAAAMTVKAPCWHMVKHLKQSLIDTHTGTQDVFISTWRLEPFWLISRRTSEWQWQTESCRCFQLSQVSRLLSLHTLTLLLSPPLFMYVWLEEDQLHKAGGHFTVSIQPHVNRCSNSCLQMGAGLNKWDFMLIWNISNSFLASII